jgi:flagellar basal-body rod protein FlgB
MSLLGYESTLSLGIAKKALDYRAMRQDMISSNIANADTPYYKPRDVRFEDSLKIQQDKLMKIDSPKLEMAQTDVAHIPLRDDRNFSKATRFYRDGHMARNDGNSVDIDVETTEMSKNSTMFNALIAGVKKEELIFKSVLEASSKLS